MKRWKKVILIILLTILVLIAAFAVWQRENLKALFIYLRSSKADISVQLTENRDHTQEVLSKYGDITVRDFTPEEEAAIINGTLSIEDALAKINKENAGSSSFSKTQNSQPSAPEKSDKPATTPNGIQKNSKPDVTESAIVNTYLGKIYGIKAKFLGKLSGVKSSAKNDFYALPSEKRTSANKKAIIADHVMRCYELENECDAQIETLLSQMKDELVKIGASTSIIGEIRSTYQNEKSIKKAYYLSMLS